MSLMWFPFNADAYTGDTGHLTTEEHGAYLLLMLAYYRSEKPLPARDRSLAATAKLSLDAWMEAKPSLAPFFREADGLWHHDVIEETIKESKDRITIGKDKAIAAANKRWEGHTPRKTKKKPDAQAVHRALPQASLQAMPQAMPVECLADAHLHLQDNSLSTRERERDLVGEEPQEPQATEPGIGSPIPEGWAPDPEWVQDTLADGGTVQAEIDGELKKFIADKQESGAFSNNWDASWIKWWSRYLDWKAKQKPVKPKGPPRIVLDTEHVPTAKNFEDAMIAFAKGMRWHRGIGPQPGDLGCKCPPEIIEKYGFDPKTGMKVRK